LKTFSRLFAYPESLKNVNERRYFTVNSPFFKAVSPADCTGETAGLRKRRPEFTP